MGQSPSVGRIVHYVSYGTPGGKYAKGPAPYMSDLWVTAAQAWGYGALTAYGDPMWNTGPISGIFG